MTDRFRGLFLITLLVAVPLSGCIFTDDADNGDADAPTHISASADTSGCREVIAVFTRPFSELAELLPAGYEPRGAEALVSNGVLDAPAPSEEGAVFLNGYTCEQAAVEGGPLAAGEAAVFVRPPDLGEDTPSDPATLDFYMLEMFVGNPGLKSLLDNATATSRFAAPTIGWSDGPVRQGQLAMDDEAGELYTFDIAAVDADPFSAVVRIWHQTRTGTAYFEYDIRDKPTARGPVVACTVRADSVASDVVGVTECGPGDAAALVFLEQGWTGSFHHLPGVRPTG